jgi:predicted ATPase
LAAESARERRERVFTTVLEQTAWLARRHPVLVLLEDLHWIDPTSQELLGRLVEQAPQWRALVLLTARPEYVPPWRERPEFRTITLSGLDRRDAAMIITEVAEGRSLPPEVAESILGRTDGVPLFIEELTKTALESGLLRAEGEHYVLVAPLPAMALPTSLEASLQARLDRLGPAIEVAQAGAALGRQFSYAVIRSVLDQGDAELQEELGQLAKAHIIHCRGAPPDAEYHFSHALLQDVAYGLMMRGKRQQLHGRIVEALESRFPDTAERAPELLAMHCAAAELTGKAADYWLKAGSRAVTRSANREAIDHLTKGLAALARLPGSAERARTELTMNLTLGHASIAVNGYCSAVTARAYARAGELIEFGDLDQRVGVLFGIYIGHLMGGRLEYGTAPLQRLLALAEEHRHSGYLCLAHRLLGVLALYRGECVAARSHLETAIALYDHGQHRGLTFRFGSHVGISARAWLSVALWLVGLPDQARRMADEAVMAARHFAHAHTLGHVLGLVTHVYAMEEEFATLAAISAEGEAFCERHRLGFFGPWHAVMELWARAQTGDPAAAIAPMRDALARYEATNTTLMRGYFRALLVRLLLLAGRPDEAAAAVEIALQQVAETGENWWMPEILGLRADVLLAGSPPQTAAAERCLRQALDYARTAGSKMLELRIATRIGKLLCAQEAERLLGPLLADFAEGFATPDLKAARALLAAPG